MLARPIGRPSEEGAQPVTVRAAATRAALVLLVGVLAACGTAVPSEFAPPATTELPLPIASPTGSVAERDGLVLEAELTATTTELIAEVVVRNERTEVAHLVPDP